MPRASYDVSPSALRIPGPRNPEEGTIQKEEELSYRKCICIVIIVSIVCATAVTIVWILRPVVRSDNASRSSNEHPKSSQLKNRIKLSHDDLATTASPEFTSAITAETSNAASRITIGDKMIDVPKSTLPSTSVDTLRNMITTMSNIVKQESSTIAPENINTTMSGFTTIAEWITTLIEEDSSQEKNTVNDATREPARETTTMWTDGINATFLEDSSINNRFMTPTEEINASIMNNSYVDLSTIGNNMNTSPLAGNIMDQAMTTPIVDSEYYMSANPNEETRNLNRSGETSTASIDTATFSNADYSTATDSDNETTNTIPNVESSVALKHTTKSSNAESSTTADSSKNETTLDRMDETSIVPTGTTEDSEQTTKTYGDPKSQNLGLDHADELSPSSTGATGDSEQTTTTPEDPMTQHQGLDLADESSSSSTGATGDSEQTTTTSEDPMTENLGLDHADETSPSSTGATGIPEQTTTTPEDPMTQNQGLDLADESSSSSTGATGDSEQTTTTSEDPMTQHQGLDLADESSSSSTGATGDSEQTTTTPEDPMTQHQGLDLADESSSSSTGATGDSEQTTTTSEDPMTQHQGLDLADESSSSSTGATGDSEQTTTTSEDPMTENLGLDHADETSPSSTGATGIPEQTTTTPEDPMTQNQGLDLADESSSSPTGATGDSEQTTTTSEDPMTQHQGLDLADESSSSSTGATGDSEQTTTTSEDPMTQNLEMHQASESSSSSTGATGDSEQTTTTFEDPMTQHQGLDLADESSSSSTGATGDSEQTTTTSEDPMTENLGLDHADETSPSSTGATGDSEQTTTTSEDPMTQNLEMHQASETLAALTDATDISNQAHDTFGVLDDTIFASTPESIASDETAILDTMITLIELMNATKPGDTITSSLLEPKDESPPCIDAPDGITLHMNCSADPNEDFAEYAYGFLEAESGEQDPETEINKRILDQAEKQADSTASRRFMNYYQSCLDYGNFTETERLKVLMKSIVDIRPFLPSSKSKFKNAYTNFISELLLRDSPLIFDVNSDASNCGKENEIFTVRPRLFEHVLYARKDECGMIGADNYAECKKKDILTSMAKVKEILSSWDANIYADTEELLDKYFNKIYPVRETGIDTKYNEYSASTIPQWETNADVKCFSLTKLFANLTGKSETEMKLLDIRSQETFGKNLKALCRESRKAKAKLNNFFRGLYIADMYKKFVEQPDNVEKYCTRITINLLRPEASILYMSSFSAEEHKEKNDVVSRITEKLNDTLTLKIQNKTKDKVYEELENFLFVVPNASLIEKLESSIDSPDMKITANASDFYANSINISRRNRKAMYNELKPSPDYVSTIWTHFAVPYQTSIVGICSLKAIVIPYGALEWALPTCNTTEYLELGTVGNLIAREIAHQIVERVTSKNLKEKLQWDELKDCYLKNRSLDQISKMTRKQKVSYAMGLQLTKETMENLHVKKSDSIGNEKQFFLAYIQMYCTKRLPSTPPWVSYMSDESPEQSCAAANHSVKKYVSDVWHDEGGFGANTSDICDIFPNLKAQTVNNKSASR